MRVTNLIFKYIGLSVIGMMTLAPAQAAYIAYTDTQTVYYMDKLDDPTSPTVNQDSPFDSAGHPNITYSNTNTPATINNFPEYRHLGNVPPGTSDTPNVVHGFGSEANVTRRITIASLTNPPRSTTTPIDLYAQVNPEIRGVKTAGLKLHNGTDQQHTFFVDYELTHAALQFIRDATRSTDEDDWRFGQRFPHQDLLLSTVGSVTGGDSIITVFAIDRETGVEKQIRGALNARTLDTIIPDRGKGISRFQFANSNFRDLVNAKTLRLKIELAAGGDASYDHFTFLTPNYPRTDLSSETPSTVSEPSGFLLLLGVSPIWFGFIRRRSTWAS